MADKLTGKEKREQKIAGRPIRSFSVARVYLNVLGRPSTIPTAYRFLITVIKNYLGTQFFQKWGIYKIPVVNVDHPLDKKIPFTPEKVDTYMDFVNLFLRPLSMLIKRFGGHKAAKTCNEWFEQLTNIYREAGKMYRNTLSTMERPKYKDNFYFRVIHAWDPHLLCVPSLHIAIIVYCFSFYKAKFKELGFSEAECFQKNTELYNDAISIAESVLYVKQHSVNCIPAALYMITKLYPTLFTPNDATNFINDMFLSAPTVAPKDTAAIKEHISFMYERFLLEGYAADDWRDPVIHWINEYDANKEAEAALKAKIAEEK